MKIQELQEEIGKRARGREVEVTARQKIEKELDDLRLVMAAKSSEDSKRQEAERSRETEMISMRERVAAQQKALDAQREGAQQLANKLRVDVEGLRQSHTATQRDLKAAQVSLAEREKRHGSTTKRDRGSGQSEEACCRGSSVRKGTIIDTRE